MSLMIADFFLFFYFFKYIFLSVISYLMVSVQRAVHCMSETE